MTKEEALNDFLQGLRIAINNASAYPKTHPYFLKSVEAFKEKIDALLSFLDPITVVITPKSLFIDGKHWDKALMHLEIAQMLHLRKLKSIEFGKGITLEELSDFLSSISLPKKEIIAHGGIRGILSPEKMPHIGVQELDYSQFLKGAGEDIDVWVHLCNVSLEKNDAQKLNDFADNFGLVMGKIKPGELLENTELKQTVEKLLAYLKEHQKEKFVRCVKDLFGAVLKYKHIVEDAQLDRMKAFFMDLSPPEFAELLWDQILTNENFDGLSFDLFSSFAGKDKAEAVTLSLLNDTANRESLRGNRRAIKKIKDLVSLSNSEAISDVYRNTLAALLRDISFEGNFSFDRQALHINYRFVLLNLLMAEHDNKKLELILEKIYKELEEVFKEKEFAYARQLLDAVIKAKKENHPGIDIFKQLHNRINAFIEDNAWSLEPSLDFDYLIGAVEKSSHGVEYYLDKIFQENKANPYGLKLFFRLFPQGLSVFYENLEKRSSDIEFISGFMETLKIIDSPVVLEILKQIFSFANEFVRIGVLKAMQGLNQKDTGFLLSILTTQDISLKKEALRALAGDKNLERQAIEILLAIPSPWGSKNKLLLENMAVTEEVGLREARYYLESLAKARFFWNRKLRQKARGILERWNAG